LVSLQVAPTALNWQVAVQQLSIVPVSDPSSHCSPGSMTPSPQNRLSFVTKASELPTFAACSAFAVGKSAEKVYPVT
jgi:hypothetical protein